MLAKRHTILRLWSIFILLLGVSLLTTCRTSETETTAPESIQTQLLVRSPETPLAIGTPVNVRSRSEDAKHGISHVELYAVQLPSGESNVLIRSDAAPFQQTSFTAAQIFTPIQRGHYVIKVVGYNKAGKNMASEPLHFDVE
jgi:hypothetical protein